MNIVILPVSNKVGKTTLGACLVHSWAKGYEPWNPVPDTFEGAVRIGDQFYMPSSLGRKPPVEIRISGEDWEEHLGKTLVPELKKWAQPNEYETKKNNVGVEFFWTHRATGSVFNLNTYGQEQEKAESFLADGWWPDEPPPYDKFAATSRGIFMKGGKVFMSMTPLKEAWVYDELINLGRADVKTIEGVSLWDAPHLYNHDIDILMKCGLMKEKAIEILDVQKQEARITKDLPDTEDMIKDRLQNNTVTFYNEFKQKFIQDAVTYALQNLKIHRFIRDLKDDTERIPRVFGEPKHLMGRVLKEFTDKNIVDPFKIPPDWPCMFEIDFHLNKPHAISLIACNPYDQYFVFEEIWDNISSEEIADEVIRIKGTMALRMNYGEIDPLSKGDQKYVKNRFGKVKDSFTIIKNKVRPFGILLKPGSKDEKSYVNETNVRFKGVNGMPTLFVFRNCKQTIKQLRNWVYDDNGKPKDDGHFGEAIGRATQTGLKYTKPQAFTGEIKLAGSAT